MFTFYMINRYVILKLMIFNFFFFCFQLIYNWVSILYVSGPSPFSHQGLIWWKTVCPQIRGGEGGFQDATSTLHLFCTLFLFLN